LEFLGYGFQLRQLRVEGFRLVLGKLYRVGGGYTARVVCLNELPKRDRSVQSSTGHLTWDCAKGVYCASGGRSALVGRTLKDFGYRTVYNMGGFKELARCRIGNRTCVASYSYRGL
jgi:hypothetical protein